LAKSLLRRLPSGRYELHELVRQYAADRLHASPEEEAETRERHCRHYLTQLQQREAALHSAHQREMLDQVTAEIDNLRLAWESAATEHRIAWLRQTAWVLWWYYELPDLYQEGEMMFGLAAESARTLEVDEPASRAAQEIAACHFQIFTASFAFRQDRIGETVETVAQGLDRLRKGDDAEALFDALWIAGSSARILGDFPQGARYVREALALEGGSNRTWLVALCTILLGQIELELGNYTEAHRLISKGLVLSRALGDPTIISYAIGMLSQTVRAQGRFAEMELLLREGYRLARESGTQYTQGLLLMQLAEIARTKGDDAEAERLYGESIALYREKGDDWSLSRALTQLGDLQLAGGAEAKARQSFMEALEIAQRGSYYPLALDAMIGIATGEAKEGRLTPAFELVLQVLRDSAATDVTKSRAEKLRIELESQRTTKRTL